MRVFAAGETAACGCCPVCTDKIVSALSASDQQTVSRHMILGRGAAFGKRVCNSHMTTGLDGQPVFMITEQSDLPWPPSAGRLHSTGLREMSPGGMHELQLLDNMMLLVVKKEQHNMQARASKMGGVSIP